MKKVLIFLALLVCGCGKLVPSADQEAGRQKGCVISSSISNKQVNCIAQDADGCIWMGTFWGLNKYDSYNFRQYFCYDDEVGLQDNQIKLLHLDSMERLWVSTVNGIAVNTGGDEFRRVPDSFTANRNMNAILETESGDVYFTDYSTLFRYDPVKDSILRVLPAQDSSTARTRFFTGKGDEIWGVQGMEIVRFGADGQELRQRLRIWPSRIFSLPNGNVWISDGRQFQIFNTTIRAFVDVPEAVTSCREVYSGNVSHLFPIGDNFLLFVMQGGGFFLYNIPEDSMISGDDPGFPFELPPFSNITTIFRDSDHNIWFGSEDKGFFVARRYRDLFNSEDYKVSFVKDKTVASIAYQQQNDVLIIATLNDGLYLYDRRTATHTHLPEIEASCVAVDAEGTLWTLGNPARLLTSWEVSPGALHKKKEYRTNYPLSMAIDDEGTVWLGCPYGVVQYLKKGADGLETVPGKPYDTFTFTPGLLPTSNGKLVVCTFGRPVKIIDRKTLATSEFKMSEEQKRNCIRRSAYIPTDIREDSEGLVWLGTVANGLLCHNPATGETVPVPGASCSDIMGILEDKSGHIWISTMYGIGMLDKKTMKFTNYTEGDGIGGNQFTDRAACALPDGTLVFGGNHGITIFQPREIDDRITVPLIFEDVTVHNRKLPHDFRQGGTLKLNYRQDAFSISFAALNYSLNENAHYYYMMDGYDSDWVNAGFSREAYYSNLPAGRYDFRVKARTPSGTIESGEVVLPIRITAAPWESTAAYIVYLAAGISAALILMNRRRRKEAERMEKEQLEKQKQFYTNIAHEFRSPLTMIAGPLSLLEGSDTIGPSDRELVRVARKSSSWMTQLVDQFLDLSRLENDTLKLSLRKTDVPALLRGIADMFKINAGTKEINFVCEGLAEPFEMPADAGKLTKITVNMLSNAFKYTPLNGTVRLRFDILPGGLAEISVCDSGPGVPDGMKEKIFERFFSDKDKGGMGIGLYYSRILAETHHGRIWEEDPKDGNGGACFRLQIPCDEGAYAAGEFSSGDSIPYVNPGSGIRHEAPAVKTRAEKDKPRILAVDDEEDVAHYLQLLLSDNYNVNCCFDADSAIKKIKEEMPELVLSDVMMPGKDGCELCREIKSDIMMSHIPVILVTAKASVDSKVEGLDAGADAYVTKPFDPKYLRAVIRSQLDKRRTLQEALNTSVNSEAAEKEDTLPLQDKAFLSRLYAVMDESLSNSEVDINKISEIMKISRTNFYYKVKSLTGETPSTFYRNYKLNKAIALMKEGKYNLTEIAYMTGFSSSSQFSTSFKKHFGVSPKEYKQRF